MIEERKIRSIHFPPFKENIMTTIDRCTQALRVLCQCRRALPWAAILLLALCFGSHAVLAAGDYPNRPIQMIVPFPAGGPADIVGRLYGQHLSMLLGQPVIIQNPVGAGGIIGTESVARANPDGHTILFGSTSTFAVNQVIMKKLPYDFSRDFALIGLIANAPHVLAVRDKLPAKTVADLIALAKQNPGKYTFATAGTGTIVAMAGELFKYEAGIDILHVPYKGGAPATLALLSGQVDMTVNDLTTLGPHFASGKLRALAVANNTRLKPLPDTPTFPELGMPKIVSSTWWGTAVPIKTPGNIQAKLRAANSKIVAEPDFVARLAKMAVEPLVLTPEQSTAFIAKEVEKWKKVAVAANIQLD
jgi:tripartite-type tricarboxylate transporter receptor subunit TctC